MRRVYILILIVAVLFPSASSAQSLDTMTEMVSENYGSIRDSYFAGGNSPMVVHIQDLHTNYDAQISIYNIINELIDRYNLNLVTVEGSVGRLEKTALSNYPDESIKEDVAQYFLKIGRINGPAFAHVMHKAGFAFYGVDDKKLYNDNVNAYKASLDNSKVTTAYYNNMKSILELLKQKAYSNPLKEFDKNTQAYKKETMEFADYVTYINSLIDKHRIPKKDYSNFTKLIEILNKEKEIDFLEVDNQRAEYIDKLSVQLEKSDLSELLDNSLYFKTGKIPALKFYEYLEDLSKRDDTANIKDEYKQLSKYIDYIRLYSEIDTIKLFDEIDGIEKVLKEKLFRNNTERKIDQFSYTLDIANDLFNLKLTKDSLQHYRDNRKQFMPSSLINFISDAAKKYGIKYKLDPSFREIDQVLPSLEKFYNIAEERDNVLAFNTLDQMRQKKTDIAVLVSGGFHTEGITKLLKDKDISYIVVTPKVGKLQEDNPYRSVLLGEEDSLDKLYKIVQENKKTR